MSSTKNKLNDYWQNFLDGCELAFDFRDFYMAMFGFSIFQGCAYYLAGWAEEHSKFKFSFSSNPCSF